MKKPSKKCIKIIAIILSVTIVAGCTVALCLYRPGYKEVWEPVTVPTLQWEDNADVKIISERVKTDLYDKDLDISEIMEIAKEDGTFEGFDYAIKTRTETWAPLEHLRNVEKMLIAYSSEGNPYYHDETIRAFVAKAVKYWVDNDFYCDWSGWNNTIGLGLCIPNILLLDEGDISQEDRTKLLDRIKSTLLQNSKKRFKLYEREVSEGGGNLTDQVNATLKVALLENDGNIIMWLKGLLENELRAFPAYKGRNYHRWDAEGPKEDFSFQQHDQLLYYGGYGEVFLNGLNRYLRYTKGTQYMLNTKALDFYADFLAEGIQFATRNEYRDISASGRGIARKDGLKGIFHNVDTAVDMLLEYDRDCHNISADRVAKLQTMHMNRFSGEDKGAGGHRYFYESDYNAYNGDKYMATVRHASNRTRIFEYLNFENHLGYYTGLGATFYYIDGDEYFNLMPMYDWNKIPGTTTRQGKVPTMNQDSSYNRYGNNKYVGGVSNGQVGLSTFKQNNRCVYAQKGYFMFEDGVVCLGTGISSVMPNEILTNINQTTWKGDVIVSKDGKATNLTDSNTTSFHGTADYIYHNKMSYITDAKVDLALEENKEGDWNRVYIQGASEKSTANVFTLDLNHGRYPIHKSYAYTVLMNTTPEETASYVQNPTLQVLANDKKMQAVYDSKNDVLEIIFLKKASIEVEGKVLSADAPCCMVVENVKGNPVVTVASNDYEEHEVKITCGATEKQVTISKRPLVVQ